MSYRPSKIGSPMGSIIGRTRKDGTTAYLAQILLKSKGKIVHRENQTFDRKQAAKAWLARRETELSESGGVNRSKDVKLADVIDRYVRESEREIGPHQGAGAGKNQRVRNCRSSLQRDQKPAARRVR
jgi:hypothetical protein